MSNETIIKKKSRRGLFGATLVAVGLFGSMLTSAPASAEIVKPSKLLFSPGATAAVSGLSVSGYDNKTVLVSLSTNVGSLNIPVTTGLTLSFGYSSFTGSAILFSGLSSDVNKALASLTFTAEKSVVLARIEMMATELKSGVTYFAQTRHFYKYVASQSITASAAKTAAEASTEFGLPGYLASVTSAEENEFIIGKLQGDNGIATNVWIGGNDSATEGTFKWTTGPEVGKTFYTGCETSTTARTGTTSTFAKWADGEPNNAIANDPYTPCTSTSTDFEGCIATNWRPSWAPRNALGLWNDLSCTSVNGQVKGYLVEYGDLELGGKFSGVFFSNFTLRPAPPVPAKPSFLKALFSIFRYKAAPVKKNVRTATYGLTLTSAGTYRFELLDKAGNLIKFLPGTVLAG